MSKLYNFKRLISKYSVEFQLHVSQGGFVAGKWTEGELSVVTMQGAIVPISERKVYASGGTYTTDDRQLYVSEPLPSPLTALKVVHNTDTYTVEDSRDFSLYAHGAVYTLKRVKT